MKFVRVDRKYIAEVYGKIDKEIMINHKETGVEKDRLNALLVRIKYDGKNRDFAIPLSHAIKTNKNHKQTYYALDKRDVENKTVGGLYFKKCLPVNKNLYTETLITKEPFLSIYKLVQEKESDIIKRFRTYLDEYQSKQRVGKSFGCSTSLDKIFKFLDDNYSGSSAK